ncbi:hypothetical protein CCAX7_10530 [Capsulimonas corticalis]|uniref:Uncharacterized protein n=1 Tax=Capsulimonas corticalis TaxID=2219043 RepID=A0A402CUK2_9BACT|nr:hypothetical protein CCAX7_10530 [Capsulimonas corticalis]
MRDRYEQIRPDWRIPDELWARIDLMLPSPQSLRKPHPLGCHRPRVPNRAAMDAIFYVLRTGCQWNALNATDICSASSAHRRFHEWSEAGVFELLWLHGVSDCDALQGIDWRWLAKYRVITKEVRAAKRVLGRRRAHSSQSLHLTTH